MTFLGCLSWCTADNCNDKMSTGKANENLHVLFGKAFLLELERGNLETAAVFARAFLLRESLNGETQKRNVRPCRPSASSTAEIASSRTRSPKLAPSRPA